MREIHLLVIGAFREALRNETMSNGGRINLVGMLGLFALLLAAGALDTLQAIVRFILPEYVASDIPFMSLVYVFTGLSAGCTLVVSLIDPVGRKRQDSA